MEKWFYTQYRFIGQCMKIQTIIPLLNPQSSFFDKTITALHLQTVKSSTLLINSGDARKK